MKREPLQKFQASKCLHCGSEIAVVSGQYLREIRRRCGLGLREAAKRFGFSAPYLSDVELERRRATEKVVAMYESLKPRGHR